MKITTLSTYLLIRSSKAAIGDIDPAACSKCSGLEYCTALNGKWLYDPVIGYTRQTTSQLEGQGACQDIDTKTYILSQFGPEHHFVDTPACHELVWNFHCLAWTDAIFQRVSMRTSTPCASSGGSKPLPPCRSLCVEVADKCVYPHLYRTYLEEVCGNIPCVTEEEELKSSNTSDPVYQKPCVPGEWEKEVNSSFSRCSIRAYEIPKSIAANLKCTKVLIAIVFTIVFLLV